MVAESNGSDWGYLTAVVPPDSTIAPQGTYMLFILADGVPGEAVWMQARSPCCVVPVRTCSCTPGKL